MLRWKMLSRIKRITSWLKKSVMYWEDTIITIQSILIIDRTGAGPKENGQIHHHNE